MCCCTGIYIQDGVYYLISPSLLYKEGIKLGGGID
jgi:hypothetical protein